MALRGSIRTLIHVLTIGGAVYYGAHEIYSHDFSNSTDVFRGPFESSVAHQPNIPILPPLEPLDDSTLITPISDPPTFTTTEYITIVRTPEPEDHGLSTVHVPYGSQNGRNPYANNPLVQSLMHAVAPVFGTRAFRAVHRVLEFIWDHPLTQAVIDAVNFVLGFFLFLWALLPEGVRGLIVLLAELSFFLVSYYAWLSSLLNDQVRRWLNASTPDDSESASGDTRSFGTQTTDNTAPAGTQSSGNTASTGTETGDNTASAGNQAGDNSRSIGTQTTETRSTIVARERDCQNNLQRVQSELARARITIADHESTIATQVQTQQDLRSNLTDVRRTVELLTERNGTLEDEVSDLTQSLRNRDILLSGEQRKVRNLEMQILKAKKTHSSEIDAAPTGLDSAIASHQDEIKRLKEAHEAETNELASTHDANVQGLRSEVKGLKDALRKAEDRADAEERHRREIEAAIDEERANASKDLQAETAQYQKRISELEKELEEERKQRESSAALSASRNEAESAELSQLRQENQRLNSLLADRDAEESAAAEQQKISAEAQENQKNDLRDCNDRVAALESANTELTQQNKTLREQEQEARAAEKKARSAAKKAKIDNETLMDQVDSLTASLSARDGNDAAIDAARRATDNEERLNNRILQLQQELSDRTEPDEDLKARNDVLEHELTTAEEDRDHWKHKAEKFYNDGTNLQNDFNRLDQAFDRLSEKATAAQENYQTLMTEAEGKYQSLQNANHLLQQNLDQQHQKCKEEKDQLGRQAQQKLDQQHQKCKEEKDQLTRQAQTHLNHERGNSNGLRKQLSELQQRYQELQDNNAGLISENSMLRDSNDNLIRTNNDLANNALAEDLAQALDMQVDNASQAPQPNASSNQPPQPNPFSNRPPLFPNQTGTASGMSSTSPKRDAEQSDAPDVHPNTKKSNALGRTILTPRSRSPPKTKNPVDGTTTAPQSRGSSPPRHGPVGFNMISSRPTTPNVFNAVTGSNRPINMDFTGSALSNAPVLRPNHNFATGAPTNPANDATMTSPTGSPPGGVHITTPPRGRDRGDAIMSSPSKDGDDEDTAMSSPGKKTADDDTAMSSPERTRDEVRGAEQASMAAILHQAHLEREERQKREHEERKAHAAREHEALLQGDRDYALGNFEPDEPANSAMDTTPNNNAPTGSPPTSDNMDTEPTGGSPTDADMANSPAGNATPAAPQGRDPVTPSGLFTPFVEGSAQELARLRAFPHNETGAHDSIYRAYCYVWPESWDDRTGEPVYGYSPPPS